MGRVKSRREICTGMRSFNYHDIFPEGRIKPNQAKRPETHIFHWEIWSAFQEIPFSPFGETNSILTVTFHPKFPFLSVNWKQPLFFQENLLALSRLITIIKLIWVVCCIPKRSKSRHMLTNFPSYICRLIECL